jgi:predicted MFS family arabinose efflux permease
MWSLVIVLLGVGTLLGADEVGVIAAARSLHSTLGAAPLFAVWGTGSLVGGLLLTRLSGGSRSSARLTALLVGLTGGHLALILVDRNLVALGVVLLLAGGAVAPTEATLYAMVDAAAPDGSITEAFAWMATAMAVGSALGAAGGGMAADSAGPGAAFALGGGAASIALLINIVRPASPPASTIPTGPPSGSLLEHRRSA